MPLKPRNQWKPNVKLQTAREEAFGKKSRARFANSVKRRCQELYRGHCGVDHRTVRRWEEGACEPDVCHQQAICEVLSVPWEEREQLGFGVPVAREAGSDRAVGSGSALTGGVAHGGLTLANGRCSVCGSQSGAVEVRRTGRSHQEGRKTKRHEFMRLVGAFACTPVPLDALERFAAYCERPRAVDEALVRDMERLTAAVGAAYDTTAPRTLLVPARLLMKRTARLLAGSLLSAERQRLMHCASEGALVVGWLRHNLGERADARAYFLLTQDLARETHDDVAQARALGALSRLHSTAYEGDNSAEALELAKQAHALLPEHAPAGIHASLAIRGAVEHAASHDVSGYERLAEQAEVAGSQVQGESGLLQGWDEGTLTSGKGRGLWLLNKHSEAELVLLDGLQRSSNSLQRAKIADSLVRVYMAQEEPEAVCSTGKHALDDILAVRYVIGLQRLLAVRQDFPGSWAELPSMQEFDELLRMAVKRLGGEEAVG